MYIFCNNASSLAQRHQRNAYRSVDIYKIVVLLITSLIPYTSTSCNITQSFDLEDCQRDVDVVQHALQRGAMVREFHLSRAHTRTPKKRLVRGGRPCTVYDSVHFPQAPPIFRYALINAYL